jgi:hypothetical protein
MDKTINSLRVARKPEGKRLDDLDVYGLVMLVLKLMLNIRCEGSRWINRALYRDQWWVLICTVIPFGVIKFREFLDHLRNC